MNALQKDSLEDLSVLHIYMQHRYIWQPVPDLSGTLFTPYGLTLRFAPVWPFRVAPAVEAWHLRCLDHEMFGIANDVTLR